MQDLAASVAAQFRRNENFNMISFLCMGPAVVSSKPIKYKNPPFDILL